MKPGLIAVLALLLAGSAAGAEAFSLWTADAMTRVLRDSRPGSSRFIHLHACRGEWEPFQVVVTGAPAVVESVALTVEMLPPQGASALPAPQLLREHYVRVTQSTPMSPLPPGEYPDALVPLDFPRQKLPGLPQVSQPYWVDVRVPYGIGPGVHHCRLTARASNGETQQVTAAVEVWDFDLPVTPTLRSQIGTVWRDVARAHGFDPAASQPPAELAALLDAYHDLLATHRLSIDHLYDSFPDSFTGRLDSEQAEQALRRQFLHRHAANAALPLWPDWPFADPLGADRKRALKYAAEWTRLAAKIRCQSRVYAMLGALDEPHLSESYDLVRKWGAFFDDVQREHGVSLPFFVTEKPTPFKPEWGSLDGAVDIWVVLCEDVWTDLEGPNPRRDILQQLGKGREVWTYPALVQIPNDWLKQRGWPKQLREGNAPTWIFDFPPMNYRILGWLMPRHGITGFSYWDTIHRAHEVDVWADAGNFINRGWDEKIYNGDGLLIYPATAARHGRHAPIASLRLKWAREMCDDYDYLTLAARRGLKSRALQLGSTFARGFGDWNDNLPALYEARRQLGELLSTPAAAQKK